MPTLRELVDKYREQHRADREDFPKFFPILAASLKEVDEKVEQMAWHRRWLQRVRQQQQNRKVLAELGASQADIERIEREAAIAARCTPEEIEVQQQIYRAVLTDDDDQDC